MTIKCKRCKGINVHSFSLRTDYGSVYAINDGIENLSGNEMPYRIDGEYCADCDMVVDTESEVTEE